MFHFLKKVFRKQRLALFAMVMIMLTVIMLAPAVSFAAGAAPVAGTPFFSIYTIVTGWLNGPLALTLSLAAVVIGLGVGIVRQNPMPALAGIAFAVFATVVPGIVTQVLGAII